MSTNPKEMSWEISKKYLIKTETMYHIGELKEVNDKEIILEESEIERFNVKLMKDVFPPIDIVINKSHIVSVCEHESKS